MNVIVKVLMVNTKGNINVIMKGIEITGTMNSVIIVHPMHLDCINYIDIYRQQTGLYRHPSKLYTGYRLHRLLIILTT